MSDHGATAPAGVTPIVMPKWGLSMKEGVIIQWLVSEGDTITAGEELAEIDTDKISGDLEATASGVLRRIVTAPGDRRRVQALLAVIADPDVDDAVIDEFIAAFPEPSEDDDAGEDGGSAYETLSVDGLQIRFSRVGDGPHVVLIHGFGGDLDNWLFNIGALAERFTVIAVDLPGHGESSLTVPDPSIEGMSSTMWSILDQLEIETVGVVGHSLGGGVAAQMAIDRPDRVASISLIASAGLGDEINQAYIDGFVTARSRREMKEVATTLFADGGSVSRAMVDNMLRYKRIDGVVPLLGELRDLWFGDGTQLISIRDDLADLGKPTLVIWGADDQVIPSSHAANADAFASVYVIDGAGHMVQMEQANEVNRLLISHIGHVLASRL